MSSESTRMTLRERFERKRRRRRLERLHRRMVDPGTLTLDAFERACACLGLDPDGLLQGRAPEELPAMPALPEARAFLDITHPGHGLELGELRTGDVPAVLGVAAGNFIAASVWSSPRLSAKLRS